MNQKTFDRLVKSMGEKINKSLALAISLLKERERLYEKYRSYGPDGETGKIAKREKRERKTRKGKP